MNSILLNQIQDIESYWKFPISDTYQQILLEHIQECPMFEVEYFKPQEQEAIYLYLTIVLT